MPTFRALDPADIPLLNQNTTGSAATAGSATTAAALSAGTDRNKLDGIAAGATKNTASDTDPNPNGTAEAG